VSCATPSTFAPGVSSLRRKGTGDEGRREFIAPEPADLMVPQAAQNQGNGLRRLGWFAGGKRLQSLPRTGLHARVGVLPFALMRRRVCKLATSAARASACLRMKANSASASSWSERSTKSTLRSWQIPIQGCAPRSAAADTLPCCHAPGHCIPVHFKDTLRHLRGSPRGRRRVHRRARQKTQSRSTLRAWCPKSRSASLAKYQVFPSDDEKRFG